MFLLGGSVTGALFASYRSRRLATHCGDRIPPAAKDDRALSRTCYETGGYPFRLG